MKIGILEDEREVAEKIRGFVQKFFDARGENVQISMYSNAYSLIESNYSDIDVLFMDIQMDLMNGMEAATYIRQKDPHIIIVFVSNLAQYAVEGYSVNAFDFILKPIDYNGFSMKLERICREFNHKNSDKFINIKTKNGFMRINLSEIAYIEVKGHDIIYHLEKDKLVSRSTMKSVAQELEQHYFSLCNNCYLVNLAYVRKVDKTVVLSTGDELSISQGKRKQFMTELAKYMGDTI